MGIDHEARMPGSGRMTRKFNERFLRPLTKRYRPGELQTFFPDDDKTREGSEDSEPSEGSEGPSSDQEVIMIDEEVGYMTPPSGPSLTSQPSQPSPPQDYVLPSKFESTVRRCLGRARDVSRGAENEMEKTWLTVTQ